MRTVAYLRVSTAQQDVRSQRLAILEYARKHDLRIDDFIEATASGQASEKRRRLEARICHRPEPATCASAGLPRGRPGENLEKAVPRADEQHGGGHARFTARRLGLDGASATTATVFINPTHGSADDGNVTAGRATQAGRVRVPVRSRCVRSRLA